MVINKYRVTISFDMAMMEGRSDPDKVCLELNHLFHEMVKQWAKDKEALVTPTRTMLDGDVK